MDLYIILRWNKVLMISLKKQFICILYEMYNIFFQLWISAKKKNINNIYEDEEI